MFIRTHHPSNTLHATRGACSSNRYFMSKPNFKSAVGHNATHPSRRVRASRNTSVLGRMAGLQRLFYSLLMCWLDRMADVLLVSQHLEFPGGSLIFVIQAISIKVQFPRGRLVLIIQAIRGGVEAEPRGTVTLCGKRRGRLVQVTGDSVAAHGAQSGSWPGQLMMHGRQVRAAVHAPKVGCGTGVALAVSRRLSVGHWV